MGAGPCTGATSTRVYISELRFDDRDRLELVPVGDGGHHRDQPLLEALYRKFVSTRLAATERHPFPLLRGVASVAREVQVPDCGHRDDRDHCCRLYSVNFASNTQRVFMVEGFGGDPEEGCDLHTTLPHLWEVLRQNPGMLQRIVSNS